MERPSEEATISTREGKQITGHSTCSGFLRWAKRQSDVRVFGGRPGSRCRVLASEVRAAFFREKIAPDATDTTAASEVD
jgi:hypothetical protein